MTKKINSQKLRYLILQEMSSGGTINSRELGMKASELNTFISGMQKDGLIEGVVVTKDRLLFNNLRITLLGDNYMKENNKWLKVYKAAKEARDWILFF